MNIGNYSLVPNTRVSLYTCDVIAHSDRHTGPWSLDLIDQCLDLILSFLSDPSDQLRVDVD